MMAMSTVLTVKVSSGKKLSDQKLRAPPMMSGSSCTFKITLIARDLHGSSD
jgi:hypothetical protein